MKRRINIRITTHLFIICELELVFINICCISEDFVCQHVFESASGGDLTRNFATARDALRQTSNSTAYIVLALEQNKWLLLSYVPPNAVVYKAGMDYNIK